MTGTAFLPDITLRQGHAPGCDRPGVVRDFVCVGAVYRCPSCGARARTYHPEFANTARRSWELAWDTVTSHFAERRSHR